VYLHRIPRWSDRGVKPSRFFSATSTSSSCRRRVSRASSSRAVSSASGRGCGRTRSANRARMAASRRSVFASWPVALAKSRTWRGFATTTGTPAAASAATTGRSNPPVASQTSRAGFRRRSSRATRSVIPASSFATGQASPVGRSTTSTVALDTSSPTNTGSRFIAPSPENGLVATRPCDMRAPGPDQLFGLSTSPDDGRRPG